MLWYPYLVPVWIDQLSALGSLRTHLSKSQKIHLMHLSTTDCLYSSWCCWCLCGSSDETALFTRRHPEHLLFNTAVRAMIVRSCTEALTGSSVCSSHQTWNRSVYRSTSSTTNVHADSSIFNPREQRADIYLVHMYVHTGTSYKFWGHVVTKLRHKCTINTGIEYCKVLLYYYY